ncbi:MAG: superoxide dismutase family protein [Deltaproteobacteria bacterium]|nr:superoxide dismutase family protein [Deltaproteobacteria bacterium]
MVAPETSGGGDTAPQGAGAAEPLVAAAELAGPPGSPIHGVITFTEVAGAVVVHAEITGVPDAGEHGFHVHDTGDCSAADFSSAGGHFNPAAAPHAGPHDSPRHAGDLGNFTTGADGTGTLDLTTDLLTVAEGPNAVVGRAVILHAARDDLATQPTGNSGARIACGVVHLGGPRP